MKSYDKGRQPFNTEKELQSAKQALALDSHDHVVASIHLKRVITNSYDPEIREEAYFLYGNALLYEALHRQQELTTAYRTKHLCLHLASDRVNSRQQQAGIDRINKMFGMHLTPDTIATLDDVLTKAINERFFHYEDAFDAFLSKAQSGLKYSPFGAYKVPPLYSAPSRNIPEILENYAEALEHLTPGYRFTASAVENLNIFRGEFKRSFSEKEYDVLFNSRAFQINKLAAFHGSGVMNTIELQQFQDALESTLPLSTHPAAVAIQQKGAETYVEYLSSLEWGDFAASLNKIAKKLPASHILNQKFNKDIISQNGLSCESIVDRIKSRLDVLTRVPLVKQQQHRVDAMRASDRVVGKAPAIGHSNNNLLGTNSVKDLAHAVFSVAAILFVTMTVVGIVNRNPLIKMFKRAFGPQTPAQPKPAAAVASVVTEEAKKTAKARSRRQKKNRSKAKGAYTSQIPVTTVASKKLTIVVPQTPSTASFPPPSPIPAETVVAEIVSPAASSAPPSPTAAATTTPSPVSVETVVPEIVSPVASSTPSSPTAAATTTPPSPVSVHTVPAESVSPAASSAPPSPTMAATTIPASSALTVAIPPSPSSSILSIQPLSRVTDVTASTASTESWVSQESISAVVPYSGLLLDMVTSPISPVSSVSPLSSSPTSRSPSSSSVSPSPASKLAPLREQTGEDEAFREATRLLHNNDFRNARLKYKALEQASHRKREYRWMVQATYARAETYILEGATQKPGESEASMHRGLELYDRAIDYASKWQQHSGDPVAIRTSLDMLQTNIADSVAKVEGWYKKETDGIIREAQIKAISEHFCSDKIMPGQRGELCSTLNKLLTMTKYPVTEETLPFSKEMLILRVGAYCHDSSDIGPFKEKVADLMKDNKLFATMPDRSTSDEEQRYIGNMSSTLLEFQKRQGQVDGMIKTLEASAFMNRQLAQLSEQAARNQQPIVPQVTAYGPPLQAFGTRVVRVPNGDGTYTAAVPYSPLTRTLRTGPYYQPVHQPFMQR